MSLSLALLAACSGSDSSGETYAGSSLQPGEEAGGAGGETQDAGMTLIDAQDSGASDGDEASGETVDSGVIGDSPSSDAGGITETSADQNLPDEDSGTVAAEDAGTPNPEVGAETLPIELDEFCLLMQEAWLAQCSLAGGNAEPCENQAANQPGAARCDAVAIAIAAGRVNYDPDAAGRCVSEEDALAVTWAADWDEPLSSTTCPNVFLGTGTQDDDCFAGETFQSACAEGYCASGSGCPGQCVAFTPQGESCGTGQRCAPDAYCSFPSADAPLRTCTASPDIGGACDNGAPCPAPESRCVDDLCRAVVDTGDECDAELTVCGFGIVCLDDSCVEEVDAGDPCEGNQNCPAGTSCFYATPGAAARTCQAPLTLGDVCDTRAADCGQDDVTCEGSADTTVGSCTSDFSGLGEDCGDGFKPCEAELYCSQDGSTEVGTCQPDRAEEQTCADVVVSTLTNSPCQEDLRCMLDSDVCLPPGELGETCYYQDADSCIPGTFCELLGNECLLPSLLGERCNLADPEDTCAEGRCQLVAAANCEDAPFADCRDSVCLPLTPLGDECEQDGDCSSGQCAVEAEPPVCVDDSEQADDGFNLCLPG